MNHPQKTARFWVCIVAGLLIIRGLCSQSTGRLSSPFYVGILLHKTWNITNVSSVSFENVHAVLFSTNGVGFGEHISQGCRAFAKYKIISLIGPEDGSVRGRGELFARQFSIPYISVGFGTSLLQQHHLHLGPSSSAQAEAIIGLAVELGSPCIGVFRTTKEQGISSRTLTEKAKSLLVNLQIHEAAFDANAGEQNFLQIAREILVMNRSGSCVVVLDCGASLATFIQKVTTSLDIQLKKFLWITFQGQYFDPQSDAFPVGVLGLRQLFTWRDLVYDATKLVDLTLAAHKWTMNTSAVNASCLTPGSPWIDKEKSFKKMTEQNFLGKSGAVDFSSDGQRLRSTYEILRMTERTGQKYWGKVGAAVSTKIHLDSTFWNSNITSYSSNIVRMATIEDDPVIIVSQESLKANEKCTLSQLCIRYKRVPISGTNQTRLETIRKCCIGYVIDILELLKKDLGFDVELYFVEDGYYGAYDSKTRTWNGLIHDLIKRRADVALTTLTINEVRSRVVDYSYAFLYGETKIMLNQRKKGISEIEFGFLAPLDSNLWLVTLAVVNVVLVLVWLLDRYSPYGHFQSKVGRSRLVFDMPACMSFIWSCVFKLELGNVSPKSASARTAAAVFAFAMLMLISTYTANLAASLVTTEDIKVSEIRDKKFTDPSSGFKFATLRSSSTEMIFSRSSDPIFRKIYDNMKPNQVKSYAEATKKLQSGELEAFIDDSPFIDHTASKQPDCTFKIVGRAIKSHGYAFALGKNSKWRDPISQLLLKYERRDYFRRLRKKWFTGVCGNSKDSKTKANSMEFKHFSGLFLIFPFAIFICVLLLVVELTLHRCRRKVLTTYDLRNNQNSVRDMISGHNNSIVRLSIEALTEKMMEKQTAASTSVTP